MVINYIYNTKMTILFDNTFSMTLEGSQPLDFAIEKAQFAMLEYGFETADIIDRETGEVLATLVEPYAPTEDEKNSES